MKTWGTIARERGRWRARAGDAARTHLGYYREREDAEQVLADAFDAWRASLAGQGRDASLLAVGNDWLERQRRAKRRGIDRERSRFDRHLASAPFASWPVHMLDRRTIQAWIREVAEGEAEGPRGRGQRRSRQTVLRVLSLLRVILRHAVELGLVDEVAAEGVVVPGRDESTAEDFLLLSAAECERLRTTTAIPLAHHAAFLVACFGGLRPGELWGLRWSDVHAHELVVRSSRGGPTKGGRVRRVPLLAPAAEALERLRAERGGRPFGLVWPSPHGGHYAEGHDAGWQDRRQQREMVRAGYRREWTQLGYRWRAGILTRLPLKDLRHTTACHLLRGTWVGRGWIARKLSMLEVRDWLGHESLTTTERYYARLEPGGLLDVVPRRPAVRAVEAADHSPSEQGSSVRTCVRTPEDEAGNPE